MQPADERSALWHALGAVALWSTVATAFKLGLDHLGPLQLVWAGTLVSALLFAALASWRRAWCWQWRVWRTAAAFGVVNPVLYYLVLFGAYDRLPAQVAQPLNLTWTIALALLAVPLLRQRLSLRALIGIAVSYGGVLVLLAWAGDAAGGGRADWTGNLDPVGIVLALGSTLLWAGYWLMGARIALAPLTLMASSFVVAAPLLTLLVLLGPGLPAPSWTHLGFGLWVGLVEMGVAFLLWQRALGLSRHAARLGQVALLTPFVSLLFIHTVLGEALRPGTLPGLVIIVIGLLLTPAPRLSERRVSADDAVPPDTADERSSAGP